MPNPTNDEILNFIDSGKTTAEIATKFNMRKSEVISRMNAIPEVHQISTHRCIPGTWCFV
jgi:hypothetical protein